VTVAQEAALVRHVGGPARRQARSVSWRGGESQSKEMTQMGTPGNPHDDADQTKERQDVKNEWEELRKHELTLRQMLQAKAAKAQERAKRLAAAGHHQAAEEARRKEQEYLSEADDLVLDAADALRRLDELEREDPDE
jgi:hypothetical protein